MKTNRQTCKWAEGDFKDPVFPEVKDANYSLCKFPVPYWIQDQLFAERPNAVQDGDCSRCLAYIPSWRDNEGS